jgi:hypothetical protein
VDRADVAGAGDAHAGLPQLARVGLTFVTEYTEPGNTFSVGKGRPPGARTKLTNRVFEDALAHWNETPKGAKLSRGQEVINTVYRQAPREYLKFVGSIISKELLVSDSAAADLSIEQVDTMLAELRRQLFAPTQVETPKPQELN